MIIFRQIFLLATYIFPATSFSARFLFEACISLLGLSKVTNRYVYYSCIGLGITLVSLHLPKLFLAYSVDSFTNLIRFSTVLVALFYLRIGFIQIFILLASLLVLNFSVSLMLLTDLEIGRVISGIFNVKHPDETHGRVAGVFHNIGVNSYFCYVSCIFYFCSFLYEFKRKTSLGLAIIAFFSLVIAQSKTGIVLLIPALIFLYFYVLKIGVGSFFRGLCVLIMLLALFFYYFEDVASSFYFISKLSSIVASGEASSLSARFDLWIAYLSIQVDSLSAVLFGLDKAVMASVSNTFDSDFIWILVNFGVLGLIFYLIMLLSLLRKASDPSAKIFRICCLFSIPFSFLIGVISQPQAALIFWTFFVNVRRTNSFFANKNWRYN